MKMNQIVTSTALSLFAKIRGKPDDLVDSERVVGDISRPSILCQSVIPEVLISGNERK